MQVILKSFMFFIITPLSYKWEEKNVWIHNMYPNKFAFLHKTRTNGAM